MTVARHIAEDELALFALALMGSEEAAFTAAHLRHCDLCRGEVARLQGDLVTYALSAEVQAPPPGARERLLQTVAQEKKYIQTLAVAAEPEPVLPARNAQVFEPSRFLEDRPKRGMGFLNWGGWALAAALAAMSGWQFYQNADLQRQVSVESHELDRRAFQPNGDVARAREVLQTLTDPMALQVALQVPATGKAAPKPEAHAAYVSSTGKLIFVASHLRPLTGSKIYELWLLPASGTSPLPAGLFRPDNFGNASVVLPSLPKYIVAKGFGVTVEEDGGSSKPTPPIVLAGG